MPASTIRTPTARGLSFDVGVAGSTALAVVGHPAVDRAAGVIHGVSAMQAVEALGHDVAIDGTTLAQVAALGNAAKSGIKARFTHPGMCSDGLGRMLGRVRNFRIDGDKVVGDLHLAKSASSTPDGDLASYVMDLAEEDPAAFGMSVVVEASTAWKLDSGAEVEVDQRPKNAVGDLPFLRISKLRAVDAVDEPAANRDGLFSDARVAAAFAGTSNADAAQAFGALDEMRSRFGLDLARAHAFVASYFVSRGFNSEAASTAGIPPATQPKAPLMLTNDKLAELCEAHPVHAVEIVKMNASGKTEAEILSALTEKRLAAFSGEVDALKTKLAAKDTESKTAIDAVEKKLAEANATIEKLRADAGKVEKFAKGFPIDPGADAKATSPKTGDDVLANQWAQMSAPQQAEFLGDFATFAAWKKNAHKDRHATAPAVKE